MKEVRVWMLIVLRFDSSAMLLGRMFQREFRLYSLDYLP